MATRTRSATFEQLSTRDFSGGPNVRDALPQLAADEVADAWNVTFDRRGGVASRLGFAKVNATPYGGGLVRNVYYSTTLGNFVVQAGASLYLGTDTTARRTFTTSDRVGFADFAGKLFAIHPVDGLFSTTNGTTWTAVSDPDAPKGSVLAVWQNKLWAAGNTTNRARVFFSDAGNGESWGAASWVDLREKDDEQVVALTGGAGIDVAGRQGLLAFKRRSTYRIYDSTSGAYQTIDPQIGAASALSVVSVSNRTFALSENGIFWTDGVGAMKPASERLRPLWRRDQIAFDQLNLFCAGRLGTKAYFSLARAGSTANDLALELDPETGAIAPGSNAASAYTTFGSSTERLYGGSPTVSGRVYEYYTTGADDGVAISSRVQTRWFEPGEGFLSQLTRLRLHGVGSFTLGVLHNYVSDPVLTQSISIAQAAPLLYDSGLSYDQGLKYPSDFVIGYADVFSLGAARSVSLRITASTTTTQTGQQIFGQGEGPQLGAWQLYGFDLLHSPLPIA